MTPTPAAQPLFPLSLRLLQVMQGAVALVALIIGAPLLLLGAPGPSVEMLPVDYAGLDGAARFLGGAWVALGVVLASSVPRILLAGPGVWGAWGILLAGGLGHNLGILRFGNSDVAQRYWAAAEVAVPLLLGAWHLLLSRAAGPPRGLGLRGSLPPRVALQVTMGLCALLSLLIGVRALASTAPLPLSQEGLPGSEDTKDTLFFLYGLWVGIGGVLAYAAARVGQRGQALRTACLVVLLGGAGRLLSAVRLGADGSHVPVVVTLEIGLPITLAVWHFLLVGRSRKSPGPQPADFVQQADESTLQEPTVQEPLISQEPTVQESR